MASHTSTRSRRGVHDRQSLTWVPPALATLPTSSETAKTADSEAFGMHQDRHT
jgi:hypothetical protein